MLLFRKFIGFSIFACLLFLAVEQSYRVYVAGPLAFNPLRANSMNVLMRSEFVQLSAFPEVFFELKPNMKGWFKGVRFSTNSAGQADKEYSLQKPADTFRVAVVGSSWTMPSGVEQEQAWHSLLERQLNEQYPDKHIEFINFGVESYGLGELLGTVRHKVYAWDPDLVVVAITSFTASFLWEEKVGVNVLPERAYPGLESYIIRALWRGLGWEIDRPADDRPRLPPEDMDLRLAQLQKLQQELNALRLSANVPTVILYLGFFPLHEYIEGQLVQQANQLGLISVYANQIFGGASDDRRKYHVSRFDHHPNEVGHQLIADSLAAELKRQKLLPIYQ